MSILVSILFQIIFPFRLLCYTEQSSLGDTVVYMLIIHFKYSSVYMSTPNPIYPSPSFPPGNHKFIL